MKIARIKEKAAQNPQERSSEAKISRNSGVGDSPNSPWRRERESWDSVLVLPRLPIVIDGTAGIYFTCGVGGQSPDSASRAGSRGGRTKGKLKRQR